MCNCRTFAVVVAIVINGPVLVHAQTAPQRYLPAGPPANPPVSKPADLSGDWVFSPSESRSVADPGGRVRGSEPDIPYRPEGLKKTLAETPTTTKDGALERTTDPITHYCEPNGVGRIFDYPSKAKFIQTPEAVYILHEVGPFWRVVWLNEKHPEDPDPQYWGHSIGWYENGDTLVVDTIGFNDRTWLDHAAHPHSENLHFIERYKRVDQNTLEISMTIDDPAYYTAAWPSRKVLRRSTTGFSRFQWVCSVRDNYDMYEKTYKPANAGGTTTFQR
jgi:hypothetical protein